MIKVSNKITSSIFHIELNFRELSYITELVWQWKLRKTLTFLNIFITTQKQNSELSILVLNKSLEVYFINFIYRAAVLHIICE